MNRLKVILSIGAIWLLGATLGAAQNFPSRPITILVGIGAGGLTDVTTRLFAEVVARNMGQSIIIENRVGGGGTVAATAVQNATPDGYTLLSIYGSQIAMLPTMQKPGSDLLKSFQPIGLICENITFVAVPAESPINSMKELLAYGKSNPKGLTFGSPGVGTPSHLLAAKITNATNTPTEFVHYRGGPPLMVDLLAGRVDFALPSFTIANQLIAEKKLKVLAVDAPARLSNLPDVPTLTDVGLGNAKVASWIGILAPPGTPSAVVDRLQGEFTKAAADPQLKARLATNGTPIRTSTTTEMTALLVAEIESTRSLIDQLGLRQ